VHGSTSYRVNSLPISQPKYENTEKEKHPEKKNVKSFPSHKAHRAALISVSLALSQIPVYTARPLIWG